MYDIDNMIENILKRNYYIVFKISLNDEIVFFLLLVMYYACDRIKQPFLQLSRQFKLVKLVLLKIF